MNLNKTRLRLGKHTGMARITITIILALMLILFISVNTNSSPIQEHTDSTSKLIEKIYSDSIKQKDLAISLTRLYKILQFFETNAEKINVDALFGLRIAQGVFIKLKNKNLSNKFNQVTNYKLKTSIHTLVNRISSLAERVTDSVKALTPEYYKQFQLLINRPYIIEDSQIISLFSQKESNHNGSVKNLVTRFDENFSDKCLDLMMKQDIYTNSSSCTTDPQCFEYFLQENASEYYLTHQLLYFLVAQHVGCSSKVLEDFTRHVKEKNHDIFVEQDPRLYNLMDRVFGHYCKKIYFEAWRLFNDLHAGKSFDEDLFIEQNILCGMLGFEKFYNLKFFNLIGNFQLMNGCFGGNEPRKLKVNGKFEDILNEIYLDFEPKDQIQPAQLARRFKRVDIKMRYGCSAHETGLAIAYFSLFFNKALRDLKNLE